MADETQDRTALTERVKASINKAAGLVAGFRKTNTRLLTATIFSSAASSLVAGITAAAGPVVGEGTEGWRVACIIAAVFGFISTVATGIGQQQKYGDRLSEGSQCVGRIRYLDVVITTGGQKWQVIAKECK